MKYILAGERGVYGSLGRQRLRLEGEVVFVNPLKYYAKVYVHFSSERVHCLVSISEGSMLKKVKKNH